MEMCASGWAFLLAVFIFWLLDIKYIVLMRERNLRLLPNFFDIPDYPSSQQLRTNPNPI